MWLKRIKMMDAGRHTGIQTNILLELLQYLHMRFASTEAF